MNTNTCATYICMRKILLVGDQTEGTALVTAQILSAETVSEDKLETGVSSSSYDSLAGGL